MDDFGGIDFGPRNQPLVRVDWGQTDHNLLVLFYLKSVEVPSESEARNRPFYKNVPYVRIQHPGESLNVVDRPATDQDKARFRRHWDNFIRNKAQVPEGTPIEMLFPSFPAVADNLKAYGVFTIEQCSNLSAHAIDTIGRGGQEYVNKAKKYLESADKGKGFQQLQGEIDKANQKNRILEQQIKTLKAQLDQVLLKSTDPVHGSQNPPFVRGYDPQTERINNNRKAVDAVARKEVSQLTDVPDHVTDPLAAMLQPTVNSEGEPV